MQMKHFSVIPIVLVFVACAASSLWAQDVPAQLKAVPAPLQWRHQPADWKIESGETLSITAGRSTDWFISPIDGQIRDNSPVLLFKAAEEFVLQAKVTVDFQSAWDAGVLVVYGGETNWAKLCFEWSREKEPYAVSVVTRGVSDDSTSIPLKGNTVYLKMAKIGQAIFFYVSSDAQAWKLIRAFRPDPASELRIGFSSQSPTGNGCKSVFSEIKYAPKRVENIWTGE